MPNDSAPRDSAAASAPYRVLARKYRPSDFAGLIGQEALVRTLTNAIAQGRLAHAFMLTGVRGVGKTTTARILARAFNCIGPDGQGGPTASPCGRCEHCVAIAEDRHVDVIEMDAASRTGVNDIRELIEGVRYRPVSARFKIYIIDEVHMLSSSAFNALLKTLEEPPEHVKFIFATTEIRKVPITVLSRCQRFDLRRVERGQLAAHLAGIAEKEAARLAPDAVALLARAADGSVRDGLSLLDRAIAEAEPGQEIPAAQVRAMLGLADRNRTLDLFEAVMKGAIAEALDIAGEMYRDGADPLTLVQDLLESTHDITRLKLAAAPRPARERPAAGPRETRSGEARLAAAGSGAAGSGAAGRPAAWCAAARAPWPRPTGPKPSPAARGPPWRGSRRPTPPHPSRHAPRRAPRRPASPRSWRSSTKGARRCCSPISGATCISCVAKAAGWNSARARMRRRTFPAASASCSRHGPASAGWCRFRTSPASRRCTSRRRPARPMRTPRRWSIRS
jgi:DNA polymerase-3 subunit gamma/tau